MSNLRLGRYRRHSDNRVVHLKSLGIRDNVLCAIYDCSLVEYCLPVNKFSEEHSFEESENCQVRSDAIARLDKYRRVAVSQGFDYPIQDPRYASIDELNSVYIEMMEFIRENQQ